jgi:LPS-assembly lipoprotein
MPVSSVVCRLSFVLCLSALLAGCFQPLYAEKTIGGGPGIRDKLNSIQVNQIEARSGTPESRLAVEVRNQLLFDFTGGGGVNSPTHELTIHVTEDRNSVIVDLTSQRPDVEVVALEAQYNLKELATGKTVVRSSTFARVSYDIPGAEQRFARIRGLRDAENRAAKEVADNIRNRLASYFFAGT